MSYAKFLLRLAAISALATTAFTATALAIVSWQWRAWREIIASLPEQRHKRLTESRGRTDYPSRSEILADGFVGAIGNTPLIRINSLSRATGCQILGKAEFLNPGGSVKDRVALRIIQEAFESKALQRGGLVTEGTSGSTGVSLAMVSAAYGCRCFVAMPDDAAKEKVEMLEAIGATVQLVRPVAISHRDNYVNVARRKAREAQEAFLASQAASRKATKLGPPITPGGGERSRRPSVRVEGWEVPADVGGESGQERRARRSLEEQFVAEGEGARGAGTSWEMYDEAGTASAIAVTAEAVEASAAATAVAASENERLDEQHAGQAWLATNKNFRCNAQLPGPDAGGRELELLGWREWRDAGSSEEELRERERRRSSSAKEIELTASEGEGAGKAAKDPGMIPRGGFFANQFENMANFRAHYLGTAPEVWRQTDGHVDAFIASAGTGGTIAGVSRFLKERHRSVKVYLADPPGSSLFNHVNRGVMYTAEEAEGKRVANPMDTITEGIGINRMTANFSLAFVDEAIRVSDREAVEMARYLVKNDGLFLGSSSAVNCVGAAQVARVLGPGHTIVTILCDGGGRHVSKFYNPEFLAKHDLTPKARGLEFLRPPVRD